MEVTQLIVSGFRHCIADLSDKSNMHLVHICSHCRLLEDICDCKHKGKSVNKMLMPLDTIKYVYAIRIALNMNINVA